MELPSEDRSLVRNHQQGTMEITVGAEAWRRRQEGRRQPGAGRVIRPSGPMAAPAPNRTLGDGHHV